MLALEEKRNTSDPSAPLTTTPGPPHLDLHTWISLIQISSDLSPVCLPACSPLSAPVFLPSNHGQHVDSPVRATDKHTGSDLELFLV